MCDRNGKKSKSKSKKEKPKKGKSSPFGDAEEEDPFSLEGGSRQADNPFGGRSSGSSSAKSKRGASAQAVDPFGDDPFGDAPSATDDNPFM